MAVDPIPDAALQLLSCLTMAATGAPNPPANFCLRIGSEIVHDADWYTDLCCEGLGYVSLLDIFPSADSFPEQDIVRQAQAVCAFPSWAVTFRMGIVRCVPTVGESDLEMPTCSQWNVAALQNMSDAGVLRRAACCFRNFWLNHEPGFSAVIGPNSTTTPEGGCVERFATVTIQIPQCDGC